MAVRTRTVSSLDLSKYKPGLVFDADGITLLGKYTDELAAHRARKRWVEVLNTYFLLERDRDYDMWVTCSAEDQYYVLNCSFISACGRYAFWRLVNRQAPEAEEKLRVSAEASLPSPNQCSAMSEDEKWVLSALTEQIRTNEETATLISRIMKLFR